MSGDEFAVLVGGPPMADQQVISAKLREMTKDRS
jgi:hypothetical protein